MQVLYNSDSKAFIVQGELFQMFNAQKETQEEDSQNEWLLVWYQGHAYNKGELLLIFLCKYFYSEDMEDLVLTPFCMPQEIKRNLPRVGKLRRFNLHETIKARATNWWSWHLW